jgi:WD40 repeat protein
MTYFAIPPEFSSQHSLLTKQWSTTPLQPRTDVFRDPKKVEVEAMDWTSNGDKLIVCTRDGALKVWRTDRFMEERAWAGSWTWTEGHPTDANIFCAVSWDGKLKIVDLRSPNPTDLDLKKTKGFEKFLLATYSADGTKIGILTRTDLIHIYDVESGEAVTITPGCEVYAIVFDNEGRVWVGTGGTPGRLLVYGRTIEGDDYSLISELVGHSHAVASLCRTRDNKYIVSGGSDALVALWDSRKLGCVRTFPNSVSPVTNVAVNGEDSLVAWGSGAIGAKDGDSVVSIAGLNTGAHYASVSVPAPVSRIKWHPTKQGAFAYCMQQQGGSAVDTNVHLFSLPE